jgi:hypothetical protein
LRYYRGNRRRVAASEAIGAMLAIAMTLIAGAAAWGFVRSQAGNSESALQANAVVTNNMLNEHFSVTDMYFPSSTSMTFLFYNTGTLTDQVQSVRLYASSGGMNLFYNYTGSGSSKADYVYDLASTLTARCKTAGSTYESPSLTLTVVKVTNEEFFTLTVPPTQSNCPSFGQTFASTTTYTIVVTGIYGNAVTYSQAG